MGLRSVYVNGVSGVGDLAYIAEDWDIEENMDRRSSFNCTIKYIGSVTSPNVDYQLDCGDEIYLYDGSTCIFAGVIVDLDEFYEDTNKTNLWRSVKAVDFTDILSRKLIKSVFEDLYVGEIITYMLANDFADFNIQVGTIEDGPLVKRIMFKYDDGKSAIDKLIDFGNYTWNITTDSTGAIKYFNYYEIGYYANTTTLENEKGFTRSRSIAKYRNRQYVHGGYRELENEISNETPTPSPDGESKEFFVRYKIGREPTIEVKLSGGSWLPVDVGIKGLEEGKDFYWSYGSTQLSQGDDFNGGAALDASSSDSIRVSYIGLVPILVLAIDLDEIDNRGDYDNYIYNSGITTREEAFSYAKQLLTKYANQADTISFELTSKDYDVGETMTITKGSPWNIDEEYFVNSIRIYGQGNASFRYEYKVLDGAAFGNWEDFFLNVQQPEVIESSDEQELLLTLQRWKDGGDIDDGNEVFTHDGEYQLTMLIPLYPANDLYPSDLLFPGTIDDTDTVND